MTDYIKRAKQKIEKLDIKAELIQTLSGLSNLPQEVKRLIRKLSQKFVAIRNTRKGKDQAYVFLAMIFSDHPDLMNEDNKTKLLRFEAILENKKVPSKQNTNPPSSHPPQAGG